MTSIPNSLPFSPLRSHPTHHSLVPVPSLRYQFRDDEISSKLSICSIGFSLDSCRLRWTPRWRSSWIPSVRASNGSSDSSTSDSVSDYGARKLRGMIDSLPPAISVVRKNISSKFAIGLYIAFAFAVFVRLIMRKDRSHNRQGSVSELVKRGQLRPDRRGILQPLKYEDPFNNPLVKVSKTDSTIEMCGKVYRLAPVTLTQEQQSVHQRRRSRAYQWKKPTVFLKEGESIPPDVDPETVRWVPSNHPFATTVSDIDEEMAQKNVSQKHGVPSRIKAEHEALQRKLDALQNEERFSEDAIKPKGIQDLDESVQSSSKSHEQLDPSPFKDQYSHLTSKSDGEVGS